MEISPAIADFRYRAFITYSHKDEEWAKWLHKALEVYRVPSRLVGLKTLAGVIPRRLAPVFRDRLELPSASDLGRKVNEALEQSANLLVICSPRSAESRYVNEEIRIFKQLGRADRIFCLIVDGEPNASDIAGREIEECFAPALRFSSDAGESPTQRRSEPIAADARPGKDGRNNAKLKLIAGMLDVGFDALKHRDQQRRVRRMVAITSLSLVAMLVTTALAIDAVIARKSAVIARHAAERRQKQAENLVDFILGDLDDKLRQVQRLDILEAADDQAMKYFQSLPTTDVTDQALAQRAKALQKIGSIRIDQGHLPAALESYTSASALAGELVRRTPADPARRVAYANSFKWIGNAYWYQGDLEHSLRNFQQAITLLENAARSMPEDAELTFNLASARTNAGRVFEARGDLVQAKSLYEAVKRSFEVLRSREPGNVRWQSELGDAYDNLGKVALEQGQLAQAVAAYRDDQHIKAALSAGDPKNHDAQENLLISDAILARTLALCGARNAAVHYARNAVTLAAALVAFDPAQTYWREDLAYYSQLLGGLLRRSDRLDEAAALDNDAVRVLGELVATDSTNTRWRTEWAQAQLEAARLQLARRDDGAAEQLADSALATINAARSKNPGDRNLAVLAASAAIVRGQVEAKRGNAGAAEAYWIRARDVISPVAQQSNDPNVLAAWCSALALLGDIDTARPTVEKLAAMGYRTPDFEVLLAAKKLPYTANVDVIRRISDDVNAGPSHKVQ